MFYCWFAVKLMSHNCVVSKPQTETSILTANIYYIKYLPIFQHFCNIQSIIGAHELGESNILRIQLHLQEKKDILMAIVKQITLTEF